jgi:nickel/cobalt transporter (NicO) family protein
MNRPNSKITRASPDRCGHPRFAGTGLLLVVLLTALPCARADTVASLLGNFTINQYCGVQLADDSVRLHYTVVFGQLPALTELHRADTNGDGVTSQVERDAYVQRLAPELGRHLHIEVDGTSVPLRLVHSDTSLPTEQGGFSLRLDADFAGELPASATGGSHVLKFTTHKYDGRFGWHEITVQSSPSVHVFNTNGFTTSLTGGLTEALRSLPPAGPLDERALDLSFTSGSVPVGSTLLGPRPIASPAAAPPAAQSPGNADNAWLQRQTRALIDLISAPHVSLSVTLLALLAALVLGAFHAFSPGHGKTIVGAYLIGSRGTARHAAFLGLTVTITHTLGVFVLGFATLFASRFIVPERLFPILSLLSGLIVLGMGMILLAQRWRAARAVLARQPALHHVHIHGPAPRLAMAGGSIVNAGALEHHHHTHDHVDAEHAHGHGHAHDHHHVHGHGHDAGHSHAREGALVHSHGGSMHSHLPPGADGNEVGWRSLLALGVSGGLIPCPSAMVVLLAAVALNKTAYGMLLVVAFSIGLAVTLTGVGLVFLYARSRIPRPLATARWPLLLPVISAATITLVGVVLCFGALQSARW